MQSLSNTLSLTFSQPINIVVEHHSEMKSLSTLDVCSPPSPVAQSMSPSTVGHTLSNWTIASQNLAAQVAPSCDYEEDIPHNDSSFKLATGPGI